MDNLPPCQSIYTYPWSTAYLLSQITTLLLIRNLRLQSMKYWLESSLTPTNFLIGLPELDCIEQEKPNIAWLVDVGTIYMSHFRSVTSWILQDQQSALVQNCLMEAADHIIIDSIWIVIYWGNSSCIRFWALPSSHLVSFPCTDIWKHCNKVTTDNSGEKLLAQSIYQCIDQSINQSINEENHQSIT